MTDDHARAIQPRQEVSPALRAVLERDLPPDVLREILAVQREWEAGEARKAYTSALIGLKRDLPTVIRRDKLVKFGNTRYTHASLAAATDAVVGIMAQHGFAHGFHAENDKATVAVTCTLTHEAGHSESITLKAPPDTSGSKNAAQSVCSTVTLLQRYTLLSILGIATADMKEPDPQDDQPGDTIDQQRNVAMVTEIRKRGKKQPDAVKLVGRPPAEWTGDDLKRIWTWLRAEEGTA